MADDIPALPLTPLGVWTARALCAGVEDGDVFFPPPGSRGSTARRICGCCPVHAECLDYAIAASEEHGIWGGLDPRERYNLKRRRMRQLAAAWAAVGADEDGAA